MLIDILYPRSSELSLALRGYDIRGASSPKFEMFWLAGCALQTNCPLSASDTIAVFLRAVVWHFGSYKKKFDQARRCEPSLIRGLGGKRSPYCIQLQVRTSASEL